VAILFTAIAAAQPALDEPLLRASTAKSLNEFGTCFTRAQDQASREWAFVPTPSGGTFSNAGAVGATSPYWLRVSEGQPLNEIRLFARKPFADRATVWKAVIRCR
jgi:hypothetical protein